MAKNDDIVSSIFFEKYADGDISVQFEREELTKKADELGIGAPKNPGDIITLLKYRPGLFA